MCTEIKELYVDYPFLKEVDSCSLEDAFKNCFSKRSNYLRFKSKYNK